MKMKNVSFELDEETHLKLKIRCAIDDIHIKVFLANLVKDVLSKEEEKQ